jgi:hypothetical protein
MTTQTEVSEQVTQLLPTPVFTPVVSGYMQAGYDLKLAALLAQLCGITIQELIERTEEASNA